MCTTYTFFATLVVSILLAGLIIIPYSESIRNAPPEHDADRDCFVFPNGISNIVVHEKIDAKWIWKSDFVAYNDKYANPTMAINGQIVGRFPTFHNDFNIIIGNKYAGRTNKQSSSLYKHYVEDCHNNQKYTIVSGSDCTIMTDEPDVVVHRGIMIDGILQYCTYKHTFLSGIYMYNNQSVRIAQMYQGYGDNGISKKTRWGITIYDNSNISIVPLILISIAGLETFSEKELDSRNVLYIILIVLFSIAGIAFLYKIVSYCFKFINKRFHIKYKYQMLDQNMNQQQQQSNIELQIVK